MTRRVPVVVHGEGRVADAFLAAVAEQANLLAGVTGLLLDVVDRLGPEPSVLVDTSGDLAEALQAVRHGHCAVTSELAPLVGRPAEFAVLRADRRLGIGAALLPGLPLADTLIRLVETGDVVTQVELGGRSVPQLVDEALAIAAFLGVQLRREDVRVEVGTDDAAPYQARIGSGPPLVVPAEGGPDAAVRTVTIRSRFSDGLMLSGPVGGHDRVGRALLADLLSLAREHDTPWRAHRRVRAGAA
jgi:hypothetical protein